jgi:hypothetical protein
MGPTATQAAASWVKGTTRGANPAAGGMFRAVVPSQTKAGRFTNLVLKGVSADLPVLCTDKFPDRSSGPSRSPGF